MPTLHLRFPGGRYHATPHGHHVNEGQIEWPPSPWRLLRALIARGYATQSWPGALPPDARSLMLKLAAVLPRYHLPQAGGAHSRHYMPLGVLDKGREKTTLVFDTWAEVGTGILAVTWPVDLGPDEQRLLGDLVENLDYLGRSESWVEATLADDDTSPEGTQPAVPCDEHAAPGTAWQQVPLAAPVTPDNFDAWRAPLIAHALEPFVLPAGKKKLTKAQEKARAKALEPYPDDLLDALQWDTARWKAARWGQAPGSRSVLYWRHAEALEVGPPAHRVPARPAAVEAILLALATPSRNCSALPTVARSLPQAEMIHQAVISRAGNGHPVDCPELTGKDSAGRPLQGHRHAYILPLDLDEDGHLDHILIHARGGLGPIAQSAIRGLKRTWQKGGIDLQVSLVGSGHLNDLRRLPARLLRGVEATLGPAITWTSATAFVPPRFVKKSGKNSIASQVQAELETHGHPAARDIAVLPWNSHTLQLRHHVRLRRGKATPPPVDCGYALRLTFEAPATGPIALGYGSHFGLGRFAPET